jgi:hypothetical protein
MKPARLLPCLAACLLITLAANAQQPASNPQSAACGATEANFTVKHSPSTDDPTQPPPGKALVYVIEPSPIHQVNIGLDGNWLGATDHNSHLRFTVDPGVHHLCAVYQGRHGYAMDQEGAVLLLRLNAEAGHIYYVRYHAFFVNAGPPGVATFERVDEDEGFFLVQHTAEAVSTLKK